MKNNRQGYVLYELLISFTFGFIVIINIFSTLTSLNIKLANTHQKNDILTKQRIIYKIIGTDFVNNNIENYTDCTTDSNISCYEITFNNKTSNLLVNKTSNTIEYDGIENKFLNVVKLDNINFETKIYDNFQVTKLIIPIKYKKENYDIELYSIKKTNAYVSPIVTPQATKSLKEKMTKSYSTATPNFGSYTENAPVNTWGKYSYSYNPPTITPNLYRTTINGKYIYYYRGNVSNNYVIFMDRLWRIVRTNEDGSVRLIFEYDINHSEFSNINSNISTWMNQNENQTGEFYNEDLNKIVTQQFCTDNNAWNRVAWTYTVTDSSKDRRTYNSPSPSFVCTNGLLNSKYGTISMDELAFAGIIGFQSNVYNYNINTYLTSTIKSFWTYTSTYYVSSSNRIYSTSSDTATYMIRPVINIKSDVQVLDTQSGTLDNPYIIQ